MQLQLSIYLSICLSVCLSVYLSVNRSVDRSIYLSIHPSIHPSIYLSLYLQAWKRSYSARLPPFLHLTTSKTKQFCETSSFLKLTTSTTKQFCETSFKNGKLSAELTASYQCVVRFFHSTCLKYCACHEEWCQVIRSAAPVTQGHPSKPEDLMRQNATPLRKSTPGPPSSSDEHVSCIAPAAENASLQILFKCPTPAIVFEHATTPSRFCSLLTRCTIPCACHAKRHLNVKKWSEHVVFLTCWLRDVLRATTPCTCSTSQLLKVLRSWSVLYIFTSTCASCHKGVHFFDVATSKSSRKLRCFVHFDFEMCFLPNRRAIFHLSSGQLAPHPPL